MKSLSESARAHRNQRMEHWNSIGREMEGWSSWGDYYHRRLDQIYQHLVPVLKKESEVRIQN